ncbi:myb-like DNA-binding domain-containing protein [Plectosphaerella cucumerina]|uniref:Myb-like DNA-binding domain-containing protein n=1 Tax=Plectosphaerella cucumerina TaxID=40658 RepID=A0A8K0T6I9_9PEZI|nr:myb-like DNA-binding domain-containing protein [Plectosphaerella cucumerina]
MPVVKGGVWTNIEDEILKASVSKYGLNQWARVSSLLARKTPKQCKARWNEWLDPSIKKIEWSKEEDEKLLHLAKLMPTQWRTIAPIVGRTANQCLERYQKLLDEAEARESGSLGLTGPEGAETRAPTADDVRRLRPGEVDPDPESKPARPDTIDLDEDEKEMLSEARARLANTQGKKAKRKARERQQEESRRLASLQKRRELKTAGINIKIVTRKPGQMDYNADIPFEKKPSQGFFDTSEEQVANERQRAAYDPRTQNVANKRKGDGDDDGDSKRRKKDNKDGNSASQAALKAGQAQKIREAEQNSKRRALNLPAPQVSEGELEEIVKMGMLGERANTLARAGDSDTTRGLVSEYSAINSQTPMRTPRAAPQEDHIANEIKNIRAMTEAQSALLGDENAPLHEGSQSTGYDGIAPRKNVVATPNPLATPLRQGGVNGATPGRPGQTPLRTPRDSFALNSEDGAPVGATPRDIKMRELALRGSLKQGLSALPKPKDSEWELELPEEQQEMERTAEQRAEDAADRDRREREIREAQEELERRRRTQVVQRGLPRPPSVNINALLAGAGKTSDDANALIAREAAALMANDAVNFPTDGARIKGKPPRLDTISDHDLAEARLQILVETKDRPSLAEIQTLFESRGRNSLLLGLGCYDDEPQHEEAAMRAAFDSVQDSIIASADQGTKLEKKLGLHLGGYMKRQKLLRDKITGAADALEKAQNALSGFKTLAISEEVAVGRRLEALREEVGYVSKREREAQDAYRRAQSELDELRSGGAYANGVSA